MVKFCSAHPFSSRLLISLREKECRFRGNPDEVDDFFATVKIHKIPSTKWTQSIYVSIYIFSRYYLLTDAPQVTLQLGSTLNPNDIKEGDDVYFECHIKANPKEHRITWSHNVSTDIIIICYHRWLAYWWRALFVCWKSPSSLNWVKTFFSLMRENKNTERENEQKIIKFLR